VKGLHIGFAVLLAIITAPLGLAAEVRYDLSVEGTREMDFVYLGKEVGSKTADRGSLDLEAPDSFDIDPFLYVWGRNVYFVERENSPFPPSRVSVDFSPLVVKEGQWCRVGVAVLGEDSSILLQAGVIFQQSPGSEEVLARLVIEHVDRDMFVSAFEPPQVSDSKTLITMHSWYRVSVRTADLDSGEVEVTLEELNSPGDHSANVLETMQGQVNDISFQQGSCKFGFFADTLPLNRLALRNLIFTNAERSIKK
jgi:hypothetical protein